MRSVIKSLLTALAILALTTAAVIAVDYFGPRTDSQLVPIATSKIGRSRPNQYFPLSPGLTWEYRVVTAGRESRLVWKSQGQRRVKGINYHVVEQSQTSGGGLVKIATLYLLDAAGSVIKVVEPTPELLLRSNLRPGQTWRYILSSGRAGAAESAHLVTVVGKEPVATPAGVFADAWHVHVDINTVSGGVSVRTAKSVWYARGVGLVKSVTETADGSRQTVELSGYSAPKTAD